MLAKCKSFSAQANIDVMVPDRDSASNTSGSCGQYLGTDTENYEKGSIQE